MGHEICFREGLRLRTQQVSLLISSTDEPNAVGRLVHDYRRDFLDMRILYTFSYPCTSWKLHTSCYCPRDSYQSISKADFVGEVITIAAPH